MSAVPSIEILAYPDDCDSSGHVNQASFQRMFERARWEGLARGPGVDVFTRHGVWPTVRKSAVEYYHPVRPGDVLRFETTLTHLGRTSFSLHQTARRDADATLVAEGNFVFVCVDMTHKPIGVPTEIRNFFGTRPSVRPGPMQHVLVRGIATAVDIQGDGPGILFIHGFPLDRTMWRHLSAPLTGWRRVAPDLRGMGLTDVPSDGYSMSDYADDLAALMDVLDLERAVVCGLSMGGYIAFEMIKRHPDRIRALILANTRADPDTAEGRKGRDEQIKRVKQDGSEILADILIPKLLAPSSLSAMPQVAGHVRTMIAGNPQAGLIGALKAMKERADSTPLLTDIKVPTLVIAGREDQLIASDNSRSLADVIPGAQFTIIPEAGHLTPMEQPIATSRVIGEFLEVLT